MRKFFDWIRWRWFSRSAATRLAKRWERQSKRLQRQLAKDRELLEELMVQLKNLSSRVERDLGRAERSEREHGVAIEALRSENQILSDTTVPTLVAQHKLILQRIDAETSIQVRRQVAARATEE